MLRNDIGLLSNKISEAEQRITNQLNNTITNLLPWFATRIIDTTTWMIKTLGNVKVLNNMMAALLAHLIDTKVQAFWSRSMPLSTDNYKYYFFSTSMLEVIKSGK